MGKLWRAGVCGGLSLCYLTENGVSWNMWMRKRVCVREHECDVCILCKVVESGIRSCVYNVKDLWVVMYRWCVKDSNSKKKK